MFDTDVQYILLKFMLVFRCCKIWFANIIIIFRAFLKMEVLVIVSIFVGTLFFSNASDSPKLIDNEFDESLTSGTEASNVRSPNFSHPILVTAEKKKQLVFVLEEEEQDKTYLQAEQEVSEPTDENLENKGQRENLGNEGQRYHYPSTQEDQLQMVPITVDQQLVNGTDGGPQQPSIAPSNYNYIIPILLCLGLLLALMILFTQYFKWTDNENSHGTDYNFFFIKPRDT